MKRAIKTVVNFNNHLSFSLKSVKKTSIILKSVENFQYSKNMTNSSDDSEGTLSISDRCEIPRKPKVICFGNVLLDIVFKTTDDVVLKKYKLNPNDQKEVSIEDLIKLTNDAKKRYKDFKLSLGGSSLNSCRILKALGEDDFLFFGAVGSDQNGKIIKDILKRYSINNCLQTLADQGTGTCVCLIREDCRSLTANIGASLHLQQEHVMENLNMIPTLKPEKLKSPKPSPQKRISQAQGTIFYVEGFFIPEKMHICRYLFDNYCKESKNVFVTNLNAPYIVKSFTSDIKYLASVADILFGNKDEFEELATISGLKSVDDLITDFFNEYEKVDKKKAIIITDGSNPVLIYEGNKKEIQSDFFSVPEVNSAEIIDTTGAGDSFVAGFLHAYLRQKSLIECVELGCEISSKVIKVIGCNLPTT